MNLEQSLAILHNHLEKVFHDARLASSISHAEVQKLIGLVIDHQNSLPAEDRLLPHYYQFIFATEALYASYKEFELTEMGNWIGLIRRHPKQPYKNPKCGEGRRFLFFSGGMQLGWLFTSDGEIFQCFLLLRPRKNCHEQHSTRAVAIRRNDL